MKDNNRELAACEARAVVRCLPHSLTHELTNSRTHSLTHSLTLSLSLSHSLADSPTSTHPPALTHEHSLARSVTTAHSPTNTHARTRRSPTLEGLAQTTAWSLGHSLVQNSPTPFLTAKITHSHGAHAPHASFVSTHADTLTNAHTQSAHTHTHTSYIHPYIHTYITDIHDIQRTLTYDIH